MRLLIGVSGGIAAYKAVEAARLAVKRGHQVRVIQTPTSERFVGRATFAGITGAPVLTGEFDEDPARGTYPGDPSPVHAPISHLALVERADVYLIAPASANTVAKLAHGHADSLVTTAAIAADCPVLVAPAMNGRMYEHPATQANLRTLADRGVTVLPPGEGELASHGERGIGRLPEPAELIDACERVVAGPIDPAPDHTTPDHTTPDHTTSNPTTPDDTTPDTTLAGVRVLVTAGGTQEPIDSVRFIGNRSSGRMGFAIAERAAARGAEVTLIAANVRLPDPPGTRVISVRTAAELADAVRTAFVATDVVLMAAAVADFRPAAPAAHKLKKDGPEAPAAIALVPTQDILAGLAGDRRPGQTIVGFAAEHGPDAIAYGREKRARKRLDAIVVNDIARPDIGFDTDDNEVVIITAADEFAVGIAPKSDVADAILDVVVRLRAEPSATPARATPATVAEPGGVRDGTEFTTASR